MREIRKTTQHLLPVDKTIQERGYDIYPVHSLASGSVQVGYDALATAIAGERCVVIDGFVGVLFDEIEVQLNAALQRLGIAATWWHIGAAMKSEAEINAIAEPFLGGDDPIFGRRATFDLSAYFDDEKLAQLQPDKEARLNILIGCGAALAGWAGKLIYIDIPKNEIQFRARAAVITNLGVSVALPPKKMYKRFYFVDWIILNKHKKAILPQVDIWVDGQRADTVTWMAGGTLRSALQDMAHNGFRVRPWFEPGAWGGQWIKGHIDGLSKDVPNYAWSFELIVPENGLLFESDGHMIEASFDTVMYEAGRDVVGEECYQTYGDEFPIRMDYLDNFDGGNLSIQCHPRREYIQKHFGEVLTQEETYYILDCKDDAVVYLGFQEGIDPKAFEVALTESYQQATPLDVPRYVQSLPAEKHGLYLMPPGTLHSSGRNNLVLEISTTPYIFTFKMYDWLALDLDGTPRPLNIRRAMENLYFERNGETVRREHVSVPRLIEEGADWKLYHLPTHPKHSYDVHRMHFHTAVEVTTEGKCHVLNLVEGECVTIETAGGLKAELHYAETYVVSAAAGSYRIINHSGREVMVVKAFMK